MLGFRPREAKLYEIGMGSLLFVLGNGTIALENSGSRDHGRWLNRRLLQGTLSLNWAHRKEGATGRSDAKTLLLFETALGCMEFWQRLGEVVKATGCTLCWWHQRAAGANACCPKRGQAAMRCDCGEVRHATGSMTPANPTLGTEERTWRAEPRLNPKSEVSSFTAILARRKLTDGFYGRWAGNVQTRGTTHLMDWGFIDQSEVEWN